MALHEACWNGHVAVVRCLLDAGANVDAKNHDGSLPLHNAALSGSVEIIELLIGKGAKVDAKNDYGGTALHRACWGGCDAMRCLLDHGADVNAADNDCGLSLLLAAVQGGDVATVELLLTRGADPCMRRKNGETVLHFAARDSSVDVLAFVMSYVRAKDATHEDDPLGAESAVSRATRGVLDLEARDNRGQTALYTAAFEGRRDAVQCILDHGADVHAADEYGWSPLHAAVEKADVATVELLLTHGADPCMLTQAGESPIELAVFDSSMGSDCLATVLTLCNFGAEWTERCQQRLHASNPGSDKSQAESITLFQWRSGLRACILRWEEEHLQTKELTKVPMEVVERGDDSVKTYLADADSSSAVDLVHRCKVCVVGPSEWGKSSLVQSIEAMKPILVHPEDRTIGIELVSSYFTETRGIDIEQGETMQHTSGEVGSPESEHKRHQVTFWDFAGQDLYQVAHSLFYSRRTIYVLVVDLQAYDDQLNEVEALWTNAAEVEMNRFLSRYVFRWVRTIFARQTDAEFLVLGTKADLLGDDPAKVYRVWCDLQSRIFQWKLNYVRELAQASPESKSTSSGNIDQLREKLDRLASKDWLVVSVTSRESIKEVRLALRQMIEASDRGFPMWRKYSEVLEAVHAKRNEASRPGDGLYRLEHGMMRVRPLCAYLMDKVEGLTYPECCEILRTLHDLGDVLWYEGEASGYLRDYVILDPMLVIDIVRGVISHQLTKDIREVASNQDDNDGNDRVTPQLDGRVKHSLLETLPLWEHMDMELVYAFKMLLEHFQLAYAAGNEPMQPDSDLIVPSYWKVQLEAAFEGGQVSIAQQSHASEVTPLQTYHCWEYELSSDLSDTVFEQFAVDSSSSFIHREVHGNCIQSTCSEFRSWSSLLRGESNNDIIRIEVAGESSELVWFNMRYYLMKLEKVLDGYAGLAVRKFVVVKGERHSLSAAVNSVRDKILMGGSQNELREIMPWLPPDLEWMVNRSWRDIGSFQQLQLLQLMRDKLDVMTKLVVAGDAQRRYPALWSLEYQVEQRVVVLRMLSDLSGKCFHEPIKIKLEPSFLAKHGFKLQTGISLLANVVGSALSVPILETAIAGAASYVEDKAQQATKIHNLIERLDLSYTTTGTAIATSSTAGLSPNGAMAVLRDLLLLYNDSMDELSVTEASNLECAATSDGHYVWAHTHEIDLMKDKLTRCQPSFSDIASTTTVSLPGSPMGSVSSSAASWTKKAGSAASSTLQLVLCVETVTGLPDWDWYKTYCTWQLCYGGRRTPLLTGATPTNADSSFQPSWRTTETALEDVDSVEMLQKCRLVVQVKRRSRIGWTKLIGVGEVLLGPLISDDAKQNFHCDPIRVEVRAPGSPSAIAPRVVECQISAVN